LSVAAVERDPITPPQNHERIIIPHPRRLDDEHTDFGFSLSDRHNAAQPLPAPSGQHLPHLDLKDKHGMVSIIGTLSLARIRSSLDPHIPAEPAFELFPAVISQRTAPRRWPMCQCPQ
jgi:hypothetical protein